MKAPVLSALRVENRVLETDDLASRLLRVATDPEKARQLHELLGGFCHQCRNTLNGLKMGFYLVKRGGGTDVPAPWADLEAQYLSLERLVERLQLICRPMPVTVVRLPLGLLLDERKSCWTEALAARDRRLEFVAPDDPAVGDFDPSRLGQALDAFAAWRARAGGSGVVRVVWHTLDEHFHLQWEEPGAPESLALIPGSSADRTDPLALPLLAKVISAHSGTMEVATDNGLVVRLRWPLNVHRTEA